MPPRTFNHDPEPTMEWEHPPMICKYCGTRDSITVSWSETEYGHASLIDRDLELEDYETDDSDNFEIHNFRCDECGEEETTLEDLILPEGEVFHEEQEEPTNE